MFETITAFLPEMNIEKYGEWYKQKPDADGTPEHPYQWPFVIYDKVVDDFVREVYSFIDAHEEMGLNHYSSILEENDIRWDARDMENADVSVLDTRTVMALIVGIIRAERFCDGILLEFFENGCIAKWLYRLAAIDEKGNKK